MLGWQVSTADDDAERSDAEERRNRPADDDAERSDAEKRRNETGQHEMRRNGV
jgi:hypothetical protein